MSGLYILWPPSKTACGPHPLPKVKAIIQEKGGFASPTRPADYDLINLDGDIIVANGNNPLADPLSDAERAELQAREASIEAKLTAVDSMLEDVLYIHDQRLYREQGTWEAYCKARWGKSRQHGYRLIHFMTVAGNISDVVKLEHESHAREFSPIKDDPVAQQEAAILALETAQAMGLDKPTAAVYKAAVDTVVDLKASGHVAVDEVQVKPGEHFPADVASVVTTASEIVMQDRQHQRDGWPWQRMTGGVFEGCLGEVSDFIQQMIHHLGGELKVRVVVYEEKPKE